MRSPSSSIRRAFAVVASVVALTAVTTSAADAGNPDYLRPATATDCQSGQEQVNGGEAWARCTGGTGEFRVSTYCRGTNGKLISRSGPTRTAPTTAESRVACLATEIPFHTSIDGAATIYWRFCERSALPLPAGTDDAWLEGAEPSGRYQVGYSIDANGDYHLLRWDNGELADLTDDLESAKPSDVNASGEMIGSRYNHYHDYDVAWRYRDGEFIDLPTRGRYNRGAPVAINGAGQIAGELSGDDLETGWSDSIPVIWSANNQITVLQKPAGYKYVDVIDIDEDGTVLGSAYYYVYQDNQMLPRRSPVVWHPDGTFRILTDPQVVEVTYATAIRNGKVIGFQEAGSTYDRGWPLIFVWDARTGEATMKPVLGSASALNARGSFVGGLSGSWNPGFLAERDGYDTRPLRLTHDIDTYASVDHLTDDDIAYGTDYRNDRTMFFPVRWDCQE